MIKVKKELINYSLLAGKRQGRNLMNKTYLYLVDITIEQRKCISKLEFLNDRQHNCFSYLYEKIDCFFCYLYEKIGL